MSNDEKFRWKKLSDQDKLKEATANPDLLSELETLFPKATLTLAQEEQYELYLKAIDNVEFSPQQKRIWELFSLKCYSVSRIARQLMLDKSTISHTLKTAIEKIKLECEKERLKRFSDRRNLPGFQGGLTTKGKTNTDDLFKERLEQHKEELEKFYEEHPEFKEGKKKKI